MMIYIALSSSRTNVIKLRLKAFDINARGIMLVCSKRFNSSLTYHPRGVKYL